MVNIAEIPPELRPALAIFLRELEGHLAYFEGILGQVEGFASRTIKEEQTFPDVRTLEHRFHVIKGGASFFQLHALQATASEGEELFKHRKVHDIEPTQLVDELRRIMTLFHDEAAMLRASFNQLRA